MKTALKVTITFFLGIAPFLRGLGTTRDCHAGGVGLEGLWRGWLLFGKVFLYLLIELLPGGERQGLLHIFVVLVLVVLVLVHCGSYTKLWLLAKTAGALRQIYGS